MSSKSFSGKELEKALNAGQLTPKANASIVGMVKPSKTSGHISFTPSGCDAWVDLPTAMIEDAEHLGEQGCKDHAHAVMKISFKEPSSAEGKILLALLTQSAQPQANFPHQMHPQAMSGMPTQGQQMPSEMSFSSRMLGPNDLGSGLGDTLGLGKTRCWRSTCWDCGFKCAGSFPFTMCWPSCELVPCTRCIWSPF